MRRSTLILSALILALAGAASAHDGRGVPWTHEQAAPLSVTEPVGFDRVNAPVTGGVPVGPLHVTGVDELMLTTEAGDPIPAQLTPLAHDVDGHLTWVLVDTLADLKAGQTLKFKLKVGRTGKNKASEIKNPVAIEQSDDAVTLTNGVLKVVLNRKKFDLFQNVWIDADGDGKFADDEKMLADDAPPSLELVRGEDRIPFASRDGKVEAVTLEDAGFVRSTVRIDGTFGDGKGAEYLKWTVRLTMWTGRPDVRVLFAIRNVNPKLVQQEKIRRASLAIKLAGMGEKGKPGHYLLGGGDTYLSQISVGPDGVSKGSQWHNKVRMEQVGPCEPILSRTQRIMHAVTIYDNAGYRVSQFQPGNREPIVDVGFACKGWVDLCRPDGRGVQVWERNFTHDNPKMMEASADGLIRFDVIPEYDGDAQPYYKDGGYWLGDRCWRTYEFNFRFHDKPTTSEADWKKFDLGFISYMKPTAETAAAAEAVVASAANRLQLVSTSEYYTASGQMWGPVVSLEQEAVANKALGRTRIAPPAPLGADALGTDFLHYENFHYRSEWDEPRDEVLEYLRTGNWFYMRRAHSFGRNYRDLGVWRTDGMEIGQRAAGNNPKAAGPIPRWGQFCDCHNYGAGLIDLWLITGDRSYRDAGVEWGYAQASGGHGYGGYGSRNWGRRMIAVLRAWQVTRDPKLKQYLFTYCHPSAPDDALRADGRALLMGKQMASWMASLCGHAVWHYYREFGDEMTEPQREECEDALEGLARQVAKYWYFENNPVTGGPYHFNFDKPNPGDVTTNGGGGPYTTSCIDMMTRGYLLTGDPVLLKQAVRFWNLTNGEDPTVQVARLEDFQGMGSNDFWARQLLYTLANPRKDATPPPAVADLKAEALGGGKVKLTWTAPADQGGKVDRYKVKHAPLPMVQYEDYTYPADHGKVWTWWGGYNVVGEPKPDTPGRQQSMILENVPAGVRHFAVRSFDDSSNQSKLSNMAKVEVK